MFKTLVEITLHEPYGIPILSATSLMVTLQLAQSLIFFKVLSMIDILGRPAFTSSSMSSQPS